LLTDLAATLREAGDARISVEGHTDDVPVQGGAFDSNWSLAAARANAVTRFLLEQGFAPTRLQSVSYADTRPVADNGSAEGRAANRRVELQVELAADAG
jgi:chemotaxis protein MotB